MAGRGLRCFVCVLVLVIAQAAPPDRHAECSNEDCSARASGLLQREWRETLTVAGVSEDEGITSENRSSNPPNKKCCENEECNALTPSQFMKSGSMLKMKCPWDVPSPAPPGWANNDVCGFDNCVGPIGVDCLGVPYDLDFGVIGTLSVNLAAPVNLGGGMVQVKTAVGSILHDLCCIEHRHGAFCNGANFAISATINLLGNTDNDCACLMEWRKAAWNLIRGRFWLETFSTATQSSDLAFDYSKVRRSWLPTGSGTNYEGPSNWGLTERRATSGLCAPAGTKLDCPGDDNNCKVPCFGLACTAKTSRRRKAQANRWNDNGRDHANAGDSDYCCSGKFNEVYWSAANTRWGKCA